MNNDYNHKYLKYPIKDKNYDKNYQKLYRKYKKKYITLKKQIGSSHAEILWCKCKNCTENSIIRDKEGIKTFEEINAIVSDVNKTILPTFPELIIRISVTASQYHTTIIEQLKRNNVKIINFHGNLCFNKRIKLKPGYQFITNVRPGEIHHPIDSPLNLLFNKFDSQVSQVRDQDRSEKNIELANYFNIYNKRGTRVSHHLDSSYEFEDSIANQIFSLIGGYNSESKNPRSNLNFSFNGIFLADILKYDQQLKLCNDFLPDGSDIIVTNRNILNSNSLSNECFYYILQNVDLSIEENAELRKMVVYKYFIENMLSRSEILKDLLFHVNNKYKLNHSLKNSKIYQITLADLIDYLSPGIFILESCRGISREIKKQTNTLKQVSEDIQKSYSFVDPKERICQSSSIPSLKLANILSEDRDFICKSNSEKLCKCCITGGETGICKCLTDLDRTIYHQEKYNLDFCNIGKDGILTKFFKQYNVVDDRRLSEFITKIITYRSLSINNIEIVKIFELMDREEQELDILISDTMLKRNYLSRFNFKEIQIKKLVNESLIYENKNLLQERKAIVELISYIVEIQHGDTTINYKLIYDEYNFDQIEKFISDKLGISITKMQVRTRITKLKTIFKKKSGTFMLPRILKIKVT